MVGQRGTAQSKGVDRFAPFNRKMSSENVKEDGRDVNQGKKEQKKAERKQSSERESAKKTRPQKTQNKGQIARSESQEKKKGMKSLTIQYSLFLIQGQLSIFTKILLKDTMKSEEFYERFRIKFQMIKQATRKQSSKK